MAIHDEMSLLSVLAVTVPGDVTTDQVADVLGQELGEQYTVMPGVGINWHPVTSPRAEHPDAILIRRGSSRWIRAQVRLSPDSDGTRLYVSGGGLTVTWRTINWFAIQRKIVRTLRATPAFQ